MVAHLLRLRLSLFANKFKRSPWQVVGLVVGLLYGVMMALLLLGGLVSLRFAPIEVAQPIVVVGGAGVVLGALLVPLLFGHDDDLDPRRFALFGIATNRLVAGLFVAGLVAIPSVVLTLAGLAQIVTWTRSPAAVVAAVVSAVLIPLTWVLAARLSTSVASFFFSTRRAREWGGIVLLLLVILASPVFVLLTNVDWPNEGVAVAQRIAEIVGWTPLAAVWAAPADAAAGAVGPAIAKLLIAAATVAALYAGWRAMVQRMLAASDHEVAQREYAGLGWFDRLPGTPVGAIAARAFIYWARDPRYRATLFVTPIAPVVMLVPLTLAGIDGSALALIPVPLVALLLGWSMHNDVAYDSTAFWLHVASNVRGRDDRLARLVPPLVIGLPIIVAGAVLCSWLHGDWSVLGSLLGVSLFALLFGLGLSSITSVIFPYPVVRPGDSPFSHPQSGGGLAGIVQALSFFGTMIAAAPVLVLAGLGLAFGWPWHLASFVVGTGLGLAALWLGLRFGARSFERRAPELLAFVVKHD